MRRLVAGEFVKLVTIRLWLWLLLGSVALTALFAVLAIVFADEPDNPTPELSTPAGQQTLFSVAHGGAGPLVAVLAAIGFAGEFRHRTATQTFLVTPRRGRVALAKLITYGLVGLGYALICIGVTIAIAVPWLTQRGIRVRLLHGPVVGTLLGVLTAVVLFAIVGAGLGALFREQTATVVALLVYLFVVEPVVTRVSAFAFWAKYLPGAAADALAHVVQADRDVLGPWQGGAVLVGYAVTVAVLGTLRTTRHDVG